MSLTIIYREWQLRSLLSGTNIAIHDDFRWLGYYIGGIRFYLQSKTMVFDGYKKYKSRVFAVPRWSTGWAIIITGDTLVNELHRLPEDICSIQEGAKDEMQVLHTLGHQIHHNPYHLSVLRANLIRHTDTLSSEVIDEAVCAIEEVIGQHFIDSSEWVDLNATNIMTQIVSRTFSRALVGAPLCRDQNFNDIGCQFSISVYLISNFINLFPLYIQDLLGCLVNQKARFRRRVSRYLGPMIQQRVHDSGFSSSSWAEKSCDILTWFLDEYGGENLDVEDVQSRVLAINSAASHTTTYTFIQALINMASRPECLKVCLVEAEEAIRRYGWTRECLDSLSFLDSFFKESMRINGLASMSFPRKMLKTFTLSDGTTLPKGAFVSAAFAVHFDEEYYPDPNEFDGSRHVRADGKNCRVNNLMAVTGSRFIPFGHGAHSCPGRFLVNYALKALMIHLLMNYDIKVSGNGVKKPDFWFSYHCTPNASSELSFRRRKVV